MKANQFDKSKSVLCHRDGNILEKNENASQQPHFKNTATLQAQSQTLWLDSCGLVMCHNTLNKQLKPVDLAKNMDFNAIEKYLAVDQVSLWSSEDF